MHDLAFGDMCPEAQFRVCDNGVLRTVAIKYRSSDGQSFMEWLEPFTDHESSEFYMKLIQSADLAEVKDELEKTSS